MAQQGDGADPEDPDEYRAVSIFWVPKEARWAHLKASAPQPTIGVLVDQAMTAIERDNVSLKGVLPKDYARHVAPYSPRERLLGTPATTVTQGDPVRATSSIADHKRGRA